MIGGAIIEVLRKFVPQENIHLQEPMAGHTTFRIGGPADCFLELENEEQLKKVRRYLEMTGVSFFVVGNGSNLLVNDSGYRGIILQLGPKMNTISVAGNHIIAQAGATLVQAARTAMEHGLTGLEFASGIPGTVGGGVVMNAGAYGGEMSSVVTQVNVVSQEGEVLELDNETMEFGYRNSVIRQRPFIVTEVTFCLEYDDVSVITSRMEELACRRREKQPLEYPSAGSTFKRPEGNFAGKLIMEAGLKGFRVGGAQVSEKHCGFVVNMGNATAQDVRNVIREIQSRVRACFGVELEPEIVFLGW